MLTVSQASTKSLLTVSRQTSVYNKAQQVTAAKQPKAFAMAITMLLYLS
jgi:hypothetical protein